MNGRYNNVFRMVRLTRGRSNLVDAEQNENQENEGSVKIQTEGIIQTDVSLQFKAVIAQEGTITGSEAYLLRHPKNDCPVLFCITEDQCSEILRFGEKSRSWFYGETVVGDGSTCVYSPYHPIFLALPYFLNSKDKFLELDDLFSDESAPAVKHLLLNKQFQNGLNLVCDYVCDTLVYRLNMEKTFDWLKIRFIRLKDALIEEGALHKFLTENDEVLSRYAFELLCDFLTPNMAKDLRTVLKISDAPVNDFERMETALKRKAVDEYEMFDKPEAKKAKESVAKKQLVHASKGTKNITNFFKKK